MLNKILNILEAAAFFVIEIAAVMVLVGIFIYNFRYVNNDCEEMEID
jgi:hypothetical protein